jgi:hypothetical protein
VAAFERSVTPVFTIWAHDIRHIDGRFFAWWDHNDFKWRPRARVSPPRGSASTFVKLANANRGKSCRAVIIHQNPITKGVASADYPHPRMARADFRAADIDARQFIVELLPPD